MECDEALDSAFDVGFQDGSGAERRTPLKSACSTVRFEEVPPPLPHYANSYATKTANPADPTSCPASPSTAWTSANGWPGSASPRSGRPFTTGSANAWNSSASHHSPPGTPDAREAVHDGRGRLRARRCGPRAVQDPHRLRNRPTGARRDVAGRVGGQARSVPQQQQDPPREADRRQAA